jgi:hypothetical protein
MMDNSDERERNAILETIADGGWYRASDIALPRPNVQIEGIELELRRMEAQGLVERNATHWRLIGDALS